MSPKKILIVAGEPSGDLYAANLVNDLKTINPGLKFFGLGGTLSKEAGVEIIFDITKLALVGLVEVWKNIFTIGKVYRDILSKVDREEPDLAILVDYPGFNLRLANELKKRSIPVVYYISPQVWAWGRDRIKIIKRCIKKIIVFFKFEEELYKTYDIDVEFIGHPLLDFVKSSLERADILKKYKISEEDTVIALLPGSRRMEVGKFLPVMGEACKIIKEKLEKAKFIIAKHPDLPISLYETALKNSGTDAVIADGEAYNVLNASDFAIVASGTATLETAIIGTPFLIVYKVNLLTYLVYKFVATTSAIGIVNIIAGKNIVPELLQFDMTAENIADSAVSILKDSKKLDIIRQDLRNVKSALGAPGARIRAAKAIATLIG